MQKNSSIKKVMTILFVVQFFTWLALFALWIYATPVFTKYIFHAGNLESSEYEKGIFWVSICFAFYSVLAASFAFALPKLSSVIGKWKLHGIALMIGAIGLLSIYFITRPTMLLFSFFFIGIAWSSISNIPYTIIGEVAPENKMTYYFSVFNFSIVIPQATAALLLGFITRNYFHGETLYTLVLGGISMMIAGVIMLVSPQPLS
ncbi:MAG: MFS transporter [Ginsengibacter sp.]